MTTYSELQAELADELNRTDLTTQIQKAIQEAIRKYERKRTYFQRAARHR
jgi:hypothetical protein